MTVIRRAYDEIAKSTIDCGPGLTEQAHKQECDINHILKDYARTGLIKHAKENEGKYDDVTGIDFQTAMDVVVNAQKMFEALPGKIRKRFGNNPAAFLDFVQNPENENEMHRMGILRGNDGIDIHGAIVDTPQPRPAPVPDNAPAKTSEE